MSIEFVVLADGLVVGGLTYVLDPELHEPARELPEDEPREAREREEERHERRGEGRREEEARERPRRLHFDINLG